MVVTLRCWRSVIISNIEIEVTTSPAKLTAMPPARTKLKRKQIKLGAGPKSAVSMRFVHIPACPEGFLMGSRGYNATEEPAHRVVIEDDFWMAETPVTQEQFDRWPGAAKRGEVHEPKDHARHSANNLNWNDAVEYCRWLTANFQKQFPEGFSVASLPTEANCEYTCRGGTETATEYHSGNGEAALREVGWYSNNSDNTTHVVGTAKGPNATNGFGLCDMHGNVWEWCLDRWDESAYQRRWDGITDRETLELAEQFAERSDNPSRVLRGGSSWFAATRCRSAYRIGDGAGFRFRFIGFRVCLVRSPFGQTAAAEPERTASQRRDGAEMAGSDGEAEILNTDFTS